MGIRDTKIHCIPVLDRGGMNDNNKRSRLRILRNAGSSINKHIGLSIEDIERPVSMQISMGLFRNGILFLFVQIIPNGAYCFSYFK